MQAGNEHAVCAVKAAGNANDHRRTTAERPLVDAVVAGKIRRIDLLRLTIGDGNDARTRYAHSYIGMGLTPVVAIDLEKGGKGSFKEIVSVVRTFAKFRPFTIQLEGGGRRRFDSLLFANIAEMAKYATLSESGRPDDGRFEVITLPRTAKWRTLSPGVAARRVPAWRRRPSDRARGSWRRGRVPRALKSSCSELSSFLSGVDASLSPGRGTADAMVVCGPDHGRILCVRVCANGDRSAVALSVRTDRRCLRVSTRRPTDARDRCRRELTAGRPIERIGGAPTFRPSSLPALFRRR
jgi:hypothetical protein